MSLVFSGIAPHGFSIIGEVAGDEFESFKSIREAMEEFGKALKRHNVDTIIVLTPHGLRLKGYTAIYTSQYCKGTLSQNNTCVEKAFECDQMMAEKILKRCKDENLNVVGCNYGALSGPFSNIELDWGTFIPLWFCTDESYKPKIVVIGPTRERPLPELIRIGEIIGNLALESNKKVALIASCDQAHAHLENGPYGYNKKAKVFDSMIIDIVKDERLDDLLEINQSLIDDAKPDSIWQMLIMYGALKIKSLRLQSYHYDVPTYFGMLTAYYE